MADDIQQADFGGDTPKVLAQREMKLTNVSPGVWSLDLEKGEAAVLYVGGDKPKLEIAPLPMKEEAMDCYGLRSVSVHRSGKDNKQKDSKQD